MLRPSDIDGNLYVGTSISELLHFVSIPGDEQDGGSATFILASRLELPKTASEAPTGVQNILLLPRFRKACVLCNSTITFYSLPELSPAFNARKLPYIWMGGRDLEPPSQDADGEVVMFGTTQGKIALARVGDRLKGIKNIDYPGCLASARRGRFACIADNRTYALLDIENQQKMPLFPISSVDEAAASTVGAPTERLSGGHGDSGIRNFPLDQIVQESDSQGSTTNKRNSSVPIFESRANRASIMIRSRSREKPDAMNSNRNSRTLSPPPRARPVSGVGSPDKRPSTPEKALPPPPSLLKVDEIPSRRLPEVTSQRMQPLFPHILSPTASEFLLITGTLANEPGVGIFVNCDGDVVRGTLEFGRYPDSVVLDIPDPSLGTTNSDGDVSEGYILATMTKEASMAQEAGIEIQAWNGDEGEGRSWLSFPTNDNGDVTTDKTRVVSRIGIGQTQTSTEITFKNVEEKLKARRLDISSRRMDSIASNSSSDISPKTARPKSVEFGETQPLTQESDSLASIPHWEIERNQQEDEFVRNFGSTKTHIVVWSGASIQWAVKNPQVLQLELLLDQIMKESGDSKVDIDALLGVFASIRKRNAQSELEFLSLQYVRQKVTLLWFEFAMKNSRERELDLLEQELLEGNLDPRVLLSMVPLCHLDIVEGSRGIWIHAGLITLIDSLALFSQQPTMALNPHTMELLRQFLTVWRQKKGYGSIPDEAEVFASVDAALLHILLEQDKKSPGRSASVRAELYSIVDHGINCFDRAIELLEQYHRLYALSRLYHSKKLHAKVLATFRRIIEGDFDAGQEFTDGENEVRKHLVRMKDLSLVEEYGTWLAKRNPTLGVQVFTDDNSKVKLPPNQVVQLLKVRAPDAVKVYLEHLVFGKKNVRYANDLISYYLDNVLEVLNSSDPARTTLAQSYETYRALQPPKPTYRQFITDNAIPDAWWHDRLRLLELLGGSHGAGFSYDVAIVLQRIEPFEQNLVPESIILDGRQGRHQQALRLLTHGLGDYHTAINYCLLGGSSIFHPASGLAIESIPSREQQATLFHHLFAEFLQIEDFEDRLEQSSELLARFSGWFNVTTILSQIPDTWSVETLSSFLVSALRRLLHDKGEAMIVKALSGAENLQVSAMLVEKCGALGPQIQTTG